MDDDEARKSLKDLGDRLDQARRTAPRDVARTRPDTTTGANSALGMGVRIGVELVVAVVVTVGIGWAVDSWFGTKPLAMVVFFFLGVAAGMWNVYRAVTGMGMKVGARRSRDESQSADWDDED